MNEKMKQKSVKNFHAMNGCHNTTKSSLKATNSDLLYLYANNEIK